eukprot:8232695-Heterocapsa_arctica.AAC.1
MQNREEADPNAKPGRQPRFVVRSPAARVRSRKLRGASPRRGPWPVPERKGGGYVAPRVTTLGWEGA